MKTVVFSCPKNDQTMILYFSKGKMYQETFTFSTQKSSNYNTLFFQRKTCRETFTFFTKKWSNYNTLFFQRMCRETFYIFYPKNDLAAGHFEKNQQKHSKNPNDDARICNIWTKYLMYILLMLNFGIVYAFSERLKQLDSGRIS